MKTDLALLKADFRMSTEGEKDHYVDSRLRGSTCINRLIHGSARRNREISPLA